MVKYIQALVFSKNAKYNIMRVLLILTVILVSILIYKNMNLERFNEGFQQDSPYVVKRNSEIYDDFYVDIYDEIMKPDIESNFIYGTIIKMTEPTQTNSVFLDIGSKTGSLMNLLKKNGYSVYGIESSDAMIEFSQKKYSYLPVKKGDVMLSMTYDRDTFSHIICSHFMIYQFKDKVAFFRNCRHWLLSNGYLIIHLVDPSSFDPIVSGGKPNVLKTPQKYSDMRITDTLIDFVDFKYKSSYDFEQKDIVVITETFTDKYTNNVRQNQQELYMDSVDDILKTAQYCGFISKGKVSFPEDLHQYIYILENPM
jgi:SAM-dependent methyltransferase